MVSQTVKVINEQGLHMRPAGVFAKEMTKFKCNVTIDIAGKRINAKSVMLIIAACIKCGTEMTIECDGEDEQAALAKAVELVESGKRGRRYVKRNRRLSRLWHRKGCHHQ